MIYLGSCIMFATNYTSRDFVLFFVFHITSRFVSSNISSLIFSLCCSSANLMQCNLRDYVESNTFNDCGLELPVKLVIHVFSNNVASQLFVLLVFVVKTLNNSCWSLYD